MVTQKLREEAGFTDKLDLILQKMENVDSRLEKIENRLEDLEQMVPYIRLATENHLDLYRKWKTAFDFKPAHDVLEIRVSSLEISMKRVKEVLENLKSA